jgi:hypothetical protein
MRVENYRWINRTRVPESVSLVGSTIFDDSFLVVPARPSVRLPDSI